MIVRYCEKIRFYATLILVLLSPIVYTTYSNNVFRVPKEVFAQVFIVIIIAAVLIKEIEITFPPDIGAVLKKIWGLPFIFGIATVIFISAISIINSSVWQISVKSLINIMLYPTLYITLVLQIKNHKEINTLINTAIIPAVISAIYCAMQYYGHDPLFIPINPNDKGSFVTAGFMDNPNLVAGYMSSIIPLTVYKIITSKKLLKKLFFMGCMALLYMGILFTSNRTSLASALVVVILFLTTYFLIYKKTMSRKKLGIYLLIVTICFTSTIYIVHKKGVIQNVLSIPQKIKTSSVDRIIFWRTAWEMVLAHPVSGIGIGTFKLHYLDYRKTALDKKPYFGLLERTEQAHNDYLQMWAETGIIGFLAAISIIISYFYKAIVFIAKTDKEEKKKEILLIMTFSSTILTILLYAITTFPFHLVPPSIVFVMAMAFSVWIMEGKDLSRNSSQESKR